MSGPFIFVATKGFGQCDTAAKGHAPRQLLFARSDSAVTEHRTIAGRRMEQRVGVIATARSAQSDGQQQPARAGGTERICGRC
jgi:hypothetical protein